MTKTKAIIKARAEVTENSTWDPEMGMWRQHDIPAGAYPRLDLKRRRVAYALELLGVNPYEAHVYAYDPGSFKDLVYAYEL